MGGVTDVTWGVGGMLQVKHGGSKMLKILQAADESTIRCSASCTLKLHKSLAHSLTLALFKAGRIIIWLQSYH